MHIYTHMRHLTSVACSAAAMSFVLPVHAATYTAKQVKLTDDPGTGCAAFGINDAAQITGGCSDENYVYIVGFTTEPKGKKATDFGLLGGTEGYGTSINNDGVLVGEATLPGDTTYHAVLRRPGDVGLTDLGTLGGKYSYGAGINDSGVIVGYSTMPGEEEVHTFVTSLTDNRLVDLNANSGATAMYAEGVNIKGIIIGSGSFANTTPTHAFYAKSPKYEFIDLGTLGGPTSYAAAISDSGLIVGYSKVDSGTLYRAFIVDIKQGSEMRDLGTPAGRKSYAYGVNNHGQVVGKFIRSDGVSVGFMCSGDCSDFVDLNQVTSGLPEGTILTNATVINKKGRIGATGSDNKLYLLTPQ